VPQGSRKYLAKLITEFANRNPYDPQCLPQQFLEKYGIPRYRFGAKDVARVAWAFRLAWEESKAEDFAINMEQVFADRLSEIIADMSGMKKAESLVQGMEVWEGPYGPAEVEDEKYARPAFRVVAGKRGLVFHPRDDLDRMALELMRARATNRLRRCEGKGCPTPLFVAYHSKQKYCYRGCGAQALAEWKADWWAERKKKKTLRRKGN
jgi:hypothetical protein